MKLVPLTPEQKNAFLVDPDHCPYCGSTDVRAEEEHDVRCISCGRLYSEVHEIVNVEDGLDMCTKCGEELEPEQEVERHLDGYRHVVCKRPEWADADDEDEYPAADEVPTPEFAAS